jgi:hypothetical protein
VNWTAKDQAEYDALEAARDPILPPWGAATDDSPQTLEWVEPTEPPLDDEEREVYERVGMFWGPGSCRAGSRRGCIGLIVLARERSGGE